MSANVETMFYVREKPWHGLGTRVEEAPTSADALVYADLNRDVIQKDVYTGDGSLIPGYKANTRSTDDAVLGIVSDRYKVVQNSDASQPVTGTNGVLVTAAGRSGFGPPPNVTKIGGKWVQIWTDGFCDLKCGYPKKESVSNLLRFEPVANRSKIGFVTGFVRFRTNPWPVVSTAQHEVNVIDPVAFHDGTYPPYEIRRAGSSNRQPLSRGRGNDSLYHQIFGGMGTEFAPPETIHQFDDLMRKEEPQI